jgi:hypothetical protein
VGLGLLLQSSLASITMSVWTLALAYVSRSCLSSARASGPGGLREPTLSEEAMGRETCRPAWSSDGQLSAHGHPGRLLRGDAISTKTKGIA